MFESNSKEKKSEADDSINRQLKVRLTLSIGEQDGGGEQQETVSDGG